MSLLTGQTPGDAGQGKAPGDAGGAGNQTITDWRSKLPDDLRSEKVFESIKGTNWDEAGPLLAKNYLHAQRLVGADKLVLPTDKSTPEEIAAFRSKLGVPGKPEEYGLKLPEGLKEEQLDKAKVDVWRKEMHEAGIPKAAAERLLSKYLSEEFGATQAAITARTKQAEADEMAVKEAFGVKYDEKVNFARFALREFGDDNLVNLLENTGMGSNPAVVKFFSAIGEKLSDDKARGGNSGGSGSLATPELAQHALNEFNTNTEKQKALWDAQHPNHKAAVDEREKLFAAAFPPDKKD